MQLSGGKAKSSLRNLLIAGGGLVVLIGAATLFLKSLGAPEKLLEYEGNDQSVARPTGSIIVKDGYLFWADICFPPRTNLYRMPLHGNAGTQIAEVKGSNQETVFTDKELIVINYPEISKSDLAKYREQIAFRDANGRWLNIQETWRADSNTKLPIGYRKYTRQRPVVHAKVALPIFHVSLTMDGKQSAVRQTQLDTQGYELQGYTVNDSGAIVSSSSFNYLPFVTTPTGIYWVRPDTKTLTEYLPDTPDLVPYREMAAHDTLMFSPWEGKAQEVMHDCLIQSGGVRGDTVAFSQPGTFTSPSPTFYTLTLGQTTPPQPIASLFATKKRSYKQPKVSSPQSVTPQGQERLSYGISRLLCDKRYYWFDSVGAETDRDTPSAGLPNFGLGFQFDGTKTRLMSSDLDGSHVREVIPTWDDKQGLAALEYLFAWKGKLYLEFSRLNTFKSEAVTGDLMNSSSYYLAGVFPDRVKTLGNPILLYAKGGGFPLTAHPMDGYYYYTTKEIRTSMFDFISNQSTRKEINGLWRVRLPEEKK